MNSPPFRQLHGNGTGGPGEGGPFDLTLRRQRWRRQLAEDGAGAGARAPTTDELWLANAKASRLEAQNKALKEKVEQLERGSGGGGIGGSLGEGRAGQTGQTGQAGHATWLREATGAQALARVKERRERERAERQRVREERQRADRENREKEVEKILRENGGRLPDERFPTNDREREARRSRFFGEESEHHMHGHDNEEREYERLKREADTNVRGVVIDRIEVLDRMTQNLGNFTVGEDGWVGGWVRGSLGSWPIG